MDEDEKAKLILTDKWCFECDCEIDRCIHNPLWENIANAVSKIAMPLVDAMTQIVDAMTQIVDVVTPTEYKKANSSFTSYKDRYKSKKLRGIK